MFWIELNTYIHTFILKTPGPKIKCSYKVTVNGLHQGCPIHCNQLVVHIGSVGRLHTKPPIPPTHTILTFVILKVALKKSTKFVCGSSKDTTGFLNTYAHLFATWTIVAGEVTLKNRMSYSHINTLSLLSLQILSRINTP